MLALVQRVRRASVTTREGEMLGQIDQGLLILLCAEHGDGPAEVKWMSHRLARLRIFDDPEGRMNLDTRAVGGALLVVSQFTLAADTSRGHRPSFIGAAPPAEASLLVESVIEALRSEGYRVETGRFGAAMEVNLLNDGPVTIPLRTPPKGATKSDR